MEYLSFESVVLLQKTILLQQKEFIAWIKDEQQLKSVLTHIQNDDYYPDFLDKSVHLFHSLIKFHIFNDGNKRTAIFSLLFFWSFNWFVFPESFAKLEDIAIWVAKWYLEKEDLRKIFLSIFDSFDFDYNSVN